MEGKSRMRKVWVWVWGRFGQPESDLSRYSPNPNRLRVGFILENLTLPRLLVCLVLTDIDLPRAQCNYRLL